MYRLKSWVLEKIATNIRLRTQICLALGKSDIQVQYYIKKRHINLTNYGVLELIFGIASKHYQLSVKITAS
jgi:hypothetical protein